MTQNIEIKQKTDKYFTDTQNKSLTTEFTTGIVLQSIFIPAEHVYTKLTQRNEQRLTVNTCYTQFTRVIG